MKHDLVLVIDFGGQYKQLIARRVRENNIYSEIIPYTKSIEEIKAKDPKAIIFTGGPNSAYLDDSPSISKEIFDLGIPILGICYGDQLTAHLLGGEVKKGSEKNREYGKTICHYKESKLFKGVESGQVWMSHTDYISKLPEGFKCIASTDNCPIAAMENEEKNIYAVQFHPEVKHSIDGDKMIRNFLYDIAGLKGDWTSENFIENKVKEIREKLGDKKALLALSGGVDSSVAAVLMHKAIGDKLTCIFVDHGLLRKDEGDQVEEIFKNRFKINFIRVNAQKRYLDKLAGVSEPEKKRKIIGEEFIRVFEDAKKDAKDAKFLVQGTIYPDVVESGLKKGDVIKSHHNVGGLPEDVDFELVEPLRMLFKDEVRTVGRLLGLPDHMVDRHPFPGPGLAIRVIGEITEERLDILRRVDKIYIDMLHEYNLYGKIWQAFAVLPDIKTVGVQGDKRTYSYLAAIRAVRTTDAMTADAYPFDPEFLDEAQRRIINGVPEVNRVVYDITSKPPGTIEWE